MMKISDEKLRYITELSRLELTAEEQEQVKEDFAKILTYMDKLNELDTTDVEEMTHLFPKSNQFREDKITNDDQRVEMLKNAPDSVGDYFKVFKTVE